MNLPNCVILCYSTGWPRSSFNWSCDSAAYQRWHLIACPADQIAAGNARLLEIFIYQCPGDHFFQHGLGGTVGLIAALHVLVHASLLRVIMTVHPEQALQNTIPGQVVYVLKSNGVP